MSSWTDGANLVPNSVWRTRTGIFRTVVKMIRYIETAAEITGEKRKEYWTREEPMPSSQSYTYKTTLARKRENTLRRNPSKDKWTLRLSLPTPFLSIAITLSLSLSLFKERRKKRKRKKDIYIYVLSADNIADTLNMGVRVYIKNLVIFQGPHVLKFVHCVVCCQVVNFMFVFSFVRLMLFSPKLSYSFL